MKGSYSEGLRQMAVALELQRSTFTGGMGEIGTIEEEVAVGTSTGSVREDNGSAAPDTSGVCVGWFDSGEGAASKGVPFGQGAEN